MQPSDALEVISRESAAFAALLQPAALTVDVPTCPGWTVGDLTRHFGGVQRWASDAVLLGPDADPPADNAAVSGEFARWFTEGAAQLVGVLTDTDPDQPCWTFGDPRTVRFWLRRQAHEAVMHRWDAASALGESRAFEHDLAHDGIDEVCDMFLPRQLRLGRLSALPNSVALECDCGRVAVVGDAVPAATVYGSASTLLLLLWQRISLPASDAVVSGDGPAARRLLALPLTP